MKKEKALLLSGKKNVDAAFAELKSAALPLIKYMAEKWHPHATAIVTSNSVEIVEGIMKAEEAAKLIKETLLNFHKSKLESK